MIGTHHRLYNTHGAKKQNSFTEISLTQLTAYYGTPTSDTQTRKYMITVGKVEFDEDNTMSYKYIFSIT